MKTWEELGIYVPTGYAGEEFYTTCPSCSAGRKKPKEKCLSANLTEGVFYCHHCGYSGTLKSGSDRPVALKRREYKVPAYVPASAEQPLYDWFAKRGISKEIVDRNQISTGTIWMPQLDKEVRAIRFPYYRGGSVVNVKYRDSAKNFRMESGAERILYGMDDCNGDTLIWVEGEIDKLSVEASGSLNCISVPDGAPSPTAKNYSSKFEFLENCEEFVSGFAKHVIAVDSDAAGKVLESELARRLGHEKCSRVTWPSDCKDANEVLIKHGARKVAECIEYARPYPVSGLYQIIDLQHDINDLYEKGMDRGESTGWHSVDDLLTVSVGQWTLVTGIPGHGKSEWLDALMVNLSVFSGWRFAIFSPENQPLTMHFKKIAEKYIGKPFHGHHRMDHSELLNAQAWANDHFTFILPPSDNLSLDSILQLARISILRNGVKGIVIDPWNELDHSRPNQLSETEYISECLSKIRRFARENQVHVWLVAHPAKLRKEKTDDGRLEYPVPTPYDVSGSAHWRNKADNSITVFRHVSEGNSTVEVHVQKVRFKSNGKPGVANLTYDYMTGRYTEEETYGMRAMHN